MEIRARGGPVIAFAPEGNEEIKSIADEIVSLPNEFSDIFAPFAYTIATQLFAYFIARIHGTDIDQPRNLAKSVTVE